MPKISPATAYGWTLYTHPLFQEQYVSLEKQVLCLKEKDPKGYVKKNASKKLAAIHKLVFEIIPQDPTKKEYRQGKTLGNDYKHWFRAKFFQQYRLFFRFHQESKIIIYAWVNDEKNKRAYGSKTDAYRVFTKMLKSGHPPDDWDELFREVNKSVNV